MSLEKIWFKAKFSIILNNSLGNILSTVSGFKQKRKLGKCDDKCFGLSKGQMCVNFS